jgi:putative resolvase
MDQIYGIERAAALLGVHPDTTRRWERQGKIRVLRTPGGKRRIPESEIRRLRGEAFSLPQRVLAIYGRVFSRGIWTARWPTSGQPWLGRDWTGSSR